MSHEPLEFPPRPLIPACALMVASALLVAMLSINCFWFKVLSGELSGRQSGLRIAAVVAAILAALCVLRLLKTRRFTTALFLAIGIFASLCSCLFYFARRIDESARVSGANVGFCNFFVSGDPVKGKHGYSSSAVVFDADGSRLFSVRLTFDKPLEGGTTCKLVGQLKKFDDSAWAKSRFLKGESASLRVVKVMQVRDSSSPIVRLRKTVLACISPGSSFEQSVLAGILCGRTTELRSEADYALLARGGVSHLVAVSGSHLAIVSTVIAAVGKRLRVSNGVSHVSIVIAVVAYVVLTGCSLSALRAAIMLVLSLVAGASKRRSHGISNLCIAAFILVLFNPACVFDLGFLLSFASVLAILLFGQYMTFALRILHVPPSLASVLGISFIAQAATLPFTVPVFGTCSLVAPFVNVFAVPLVSAGLSLGLFLLPLSLFPAIGCQFVVLASVPIRAMHFALSVACSFSYASIQIGFDALLIWSSVFAFMLIYVFWPRPMFCPCAAAIFTSVAVCLLYFVYWTHFAPACMTVMDVGQADSILIRDSASCMVVDAGVDSKILDAVARNHVYRIDAVVITHWDKDHWGGLLDLHDRVDIGSIYVAEGAAANAPKEVLSFYGSKLIELREGDSLEIGSFEARCVWPRESVKGSENEDSLCLKVTYGSAFSTLLTGDAECESENAFDAGVGDIDVLKLAHHGSKASVDQTVIDTLMPEFAIASAGAGNTYGHPSRECRDMLAKNGISFLNTIDNGDVSIYPSDTGYEVRTER